MTLSARLVLTASPSPAVRSVHVLESCEIGAQWPELTYPTPNRAYPVLALFATTRVGQAPRRDFISPRDSMAAKNNSEPELMDILNAVVRLRSLISTEIVASRQSRAQSASLSQPLRGTQRLWRDNFSVNWQMVDRGRPPMGPPDGRLDSQVSHQVGVGVRAPWEAKINPPNQKD